MITLLHSKHNNICYVMFSNGDWGLGPIPNPQSPIPNPQSPLIEFCIIKVNNKFN